MSTQRYRLAPGLITEDLGQELLVCDTEHSLVHRLSGPTAEVLRRLIAGDGDSIALDDDDLTRGLEDIGVIVVVDAAESGVLSRRRVIRAGVAAGTIGIATLVLPQAAAASSVAEETSEGGSSPGPEAGFFRRVTTNGTASLELRWESNGDPFNFTWTVNTVPPTTGSGTANGEFFTAVSGLARGLNLTVTAVSEFNKTESRTFNTS